MIARLRLITAAGMAIALAACATAGPKPPILGRFVEVRTNGDSRASIAGELLAVGKDELWVREPDRVSDVPLGGITVVRVRRHDLTGQQAGLWLGIGGALTTGALLVACSSIEGGSCAGVGAAVALSWAVIGGPSAAALAKSSRVEVRGPDWESLREYARFPQGLPPDLDPNLLAVPPEIAPRGKPAPAAQRRLTR